MPRRSSRPTSLGATCALRRGRSGWRAGVGDTARFLCVRRTVGVQAGHLPIGTGVLVATFPLLGGRFAPSAPSPAKPGPNAGCGGSRRRGWPRGEALRHASLRAPVSGGLGSRGIKA